MCVVNVKTIAAHNMSAGQSAVLFNTQSAGGTNFDGNYTILAVPSTTTLTLLSLDQTRLHQPLDTGGSGTVGGVQFDTPTAPQAGQAFAVKGLTTQGVYAPFSVNGLFSAAPGTFELDVQVAQIDAEVNYQTVSNGAISTVDATNQTFTFEAQLNGAPFARLKLRTLGNAVGIIAVIKR